MKSRIGKHFSSAHAIALLALFVAVGGTAYAATKIGTNQIRNGAVTAAKIKNNAIVPAKVKAKAIGTGKLADGAVTASKLAKGSVTPAKMTEYTNSGLVKLSKGSEKVLLSRGGLKLTAKCEDGGGGVVHAALVAKNTGTEAGLFESDYEGNYTDPGFDPGEELNAFYTVDQSVPYWFGEYYNMFSMTNADGSTSLYGGGNIGTNVLGSDCVYQLFTWGA